MRRRNMLKSKSLLLLTLQLLFFWLSWKRCEAQVDTEEANEPPDDGGHSDAFFALQSCHQLLRGDSGEFFSPDYLCSNPSLWCNWTIQVDPGKRIHLHLEDLTPDNTCHLKQDQVHVDEPGSRYGVHEILEKCWQEAKYTTTTNTVNVVLLIGRWPNSPYRGFYSRYQAFGLPVMYNPQEVLIERDERSEPTLDVTDFGTVIDSEHMGSKTDFDEMYDYYDQHSAMPDEQTWESKDGIDTEAEVGENLHPPSGWNFSHVFPITAVPTLPVSIPRTSRSERELTHTQSNRLDSDGPSHQLQPSTRPPVAVRRNVIEEEEEVDDDDNNSTEVSETSDQHPPTSVGPEAEETEHTHPHPNMVEPLLDHRQRFHRNHSEVPNLPGDQLFEVTIEVDFRPDVGESWFVAATLLLPSLKTLIRDRLEALSSPLSMSSKRIQKLNAGLLYILWLQIGPGSGGPQVHSIVDAAIQSLNATDVGGVIHKRVVIVSTHTDVNECRTQLVLCDVNADCAHQLGLHSCHCRPGFLDQSRLGSGGTLCVDKTAAGCSSGLSAETKGVYVLFFLLSCLILMLLAAAAMLYRRHHRGTFLVRCHSSSSMSPPDPNNNNNGHRCDGYSHRADTEMPVPPPPPRGTSRESWLQVKELCPAVDLPLLRFTPLQPPDSYMEPREGGKM
ncbi:uncharacterized protein zgc:66455 [Solea solea]|uniref:uncharacterized protein zgc:66455 n=1 Tax=Solea solea TaxID=90069 RepID=UPI00272CC889|nr:uncharacterized protein zgc:66455 [Solea solea]